MIDCAALASLRNALSPFPAIACVVVLENALRIGCQHGATQYADGRQSGRTEGVAAYGSRNLEVLNFILLTILNNRDQHPSRWAKG